MPKLLFPKNGATVNVYTPLQEAFLDKIKNIGAEHALQWLLPIKNGQEVSYPVTISLQWTSDGENTFVVELSEEQNFYAPYVMHTDKPSRDISNLKIGQTYYWRVNGSEPFSFRTSHKGYRFVRIDGLMNVRDLGGIGIRQGLLYRGSDIEGEYQITPEGMRAFCKELKIRTELNLRKEHLAISRTGTPEGVQYICLPYRPYKEVYEEEHRRGICAIMDYLADENNYPVYFHCLGGADRTGMIAIFLRALVGETDEDIFTDYELTSLSAYAGGLAEGAAANGFRSRNSEYFKEFLRLLDAYGAGESLSVKVPRFLLDCGVTENTIHKILEIIKV